MTYFQLLLTFDPVLVEKVALLLYLVVQDNPSLPRLYLTGVFYFILMYTGSNVLPLARFLKYCHLKQAFRSEEVSLIAGSHMPSLITHWLPMHSFATGICSHSLADKLIQPLAESYSLTDACMHSVTYSKN